MLTSLITANVECKQFPRVIDASFCGIVLRALCCPLTEKLAKGLFFIYPQQVCRRMTVGRNTFCLQPITLLVRFIGIRIQEKRRGGEIKVNVRLERIGGREGQEMYSSKTMRADVCVCV